MRFPSIGFIGLGSQGGPMARRIAEEGFALTAWARRPESYDALAGVSFARAADPAAVGAASQIVCLCPVTDADVEDLVLRKDGVLAGMKPGGVLVIHSTIHPSTCRRIAEQAGKQGVRTLDAPVSGGSMAAAERRLLVIVGGDEECFERARPMMETYASPVLHVGALGNGLLAKAINNFVLAAQKVLAFETFELARGLGMGPQEIAQVLAHGSGGSTAVSIFARTDGKVSVLLPTAHLVRKDVQIALDLCRASDIAPPEHIAALAARLCADLGVPLDE